MYVSSFQFFYVGLETNNQEQTIYYYWSRPEREKQSHCVHPQYDAFTNAHDIGIQRLPIPIHPAIVPIRHRSQTVAME